MAGGLLGQGSLTTYNPTFREKVTDALRGLLFSDDREGQRKAERLSDVLEFTPYGAATAVDDVKEAVGQGDWATAGMMGAMAMVPGPSPKIKAYHGSPHSFDRFSMDKIGTGEGAQAYGHGLYFAENEGVARGYRDTLSKQQGQRIVGGVPENTGDPVHLAAGVLSDNSGDRAKAIAELRQTMADGNIPPGFEQTANETLRVLEAGTELPSVQIQPNPGSMYEVNINASPDDFLDWDKPLSEQGPKVQETLAKINPDYHPTSDEYDANELGQIAYNRLLEDFHLKRQPAKPYLQSKADITDRLKQAGIPGIKYLDAGSRGKGDGSRNYVVFDDKLIEIVRKYGIAGASAMLGYNILNMVDPAQAQQMQQVDAQRPQMARSGW